MKVNPDKVLVLVPPGYKKDDESCWGHSVEVCCMYNNSRSMNNRLKLRLSLFFGKTQWIMNADLANIDLDYFDVIIVNQVIYPELIIKYIRSKNNHCKLFYWLWDSVKYMGDAWCYNGKYHWNVLNNMRKKYNFDILSFDKEDCKKYHFIFHNQTIPIYNDLMREPIQYDSVYFCGHEKGRLPLLKKLGVEMLEKGLKPCFEIVPSIKLQNIDIKGYEHFISIVKRKSYRELVKEELSHKAILEIVQNGQNGLTWRAIEALIYKRKLITNYIDIKEYDFYNNSNIFIIGEDNFDKLPLFLGAGMEELSSEITNRYTFDGWLSSFLNKA